MKGKPDKAFRALLRRYHRLVDREFLHGLTLKEARHMEALGRRIDACDEPFYAPIIVMIEQSGKPE